MCGAPGCGSGTPSDRRRVPVRGGIDRRNFLRLAGLVGVGVGTATVVGACSPTGSPTGSPAPGDLPPATSSTIAPVVPPTTAPAPAALPAGAVPVGEPAAVAAAHRGLVPTEWGLDVSGVHSRLADPGSPGAPTLALTLDGCGGPGGDAADVALLDALLTRGVPATVFVNLRWVEANRRLVEELAADPLVELANHGTRHLPLSVTGRSAYGIAGTVDVDDAVAEVWDAHEALSALTGAPPRWFRSGTAHYDEVGASIAVGLGERPVGFTTNGDAGATAPASVVEAELLAAPPGGIVIAHCNRPGSGTAPGVAAAVDRLLATGTRFVTLSGGGGTAV